MAILTVQLCFWSLERVFNFSLWFSCLLNDNIIDSLKIPTRFISRRLIYPFKTGVYFLFYHSYILHGDLYGSQLSLQLSLMLEGSKIQEHAKPKPQKLYPRVKKGSELWGDHKQIRILFPTPVPKSPTNNKTSPL